MDDDLFMFSSSRSPDSTPRKPISLSLSKKRKLQTTHNDRNDSIQSDSKSLSPPEQLDEKPKRRIVKDEEEDEDNYLMIDDAINDTAFWQQLDRVEKQYHDKEQPQHNIKAANDLKNEGHNDETFASENDDMDSWPDFDDDPVATTPQPASTTDIKMERRSSVIELDCDEDIFQSHTPADPVTKHSNGTNMDTSEDEATKQLKALAVSKPIPTKRKVGEDVFTESCVKTWQMSRIKAWESRYVNPEGYYFRFVVPGEGQRNGGWTASEHKCFMDRYHEWIAKGWKIGYAWGLFSQKIPHRVGYQCMNYYRKLVGDKKIVDPSYAMVDGKLKQINKDRSIGTPVSSKLGDEWESEEVKEIERNVDRWLKEYHRRSGTASTSTPRPRLPATPRAPKTPSTRKPISDMVKKIPPPRQPLFVFDDDEDDEDAMDVFLSTQEPEHANLHVRKHDYEKELRERLEAYNKFMQPFLDPIKRHEYWRAKQEWRRGLTTTEMLVAKKTAALKTALPEEKPTTVRQSNLSMFFTGVKKPKQDTPDDLISKVIIPNELFSGVHHVKPLGLDQARPSISENGRSYYCELDDMAECPTILEALLGPANQEPSGKGSSPLEGILADPPWDFYVKDGRNDGRCSWTLKDMMRLMKKVLTRMTAGLVFVWTHKLLQADVVRLMDELDCRYVENLVWFKKYVNNIPVDQPSPYISSSKEILLIFRKGDGFELRHQRSPDVIIDFEQPASQWIQHEFTEPKPAAVYDMIETLLPKAGYNEELGRGRLLDLWTKRDAPRRDGWIAFHQRKTDPMTTSATARDDTTKETDVIHDKAKNETSSNSIDEDSIMDIL